MDNKASRTAQGVAIHRATHQILDTPPVFNDPLAMKIIGNAAEADALANPRKNQANNLRAALAVRSRYAEDKLAEAIKKGAQQYVIMGAGLDTFAYRNPYTKSDLHVFEVDHPATQLWKRERLREVNLTIPDNLSFAPVNFKEQTLVKELERANFKNNKPTFFSLLGVIVFLEKGEAMELLEFVASLPVGSGIVFDYGILHTSLTEEQRIIRETTAKQLAKAGEPLITFFDPEELKKSLQDMGFNKIENIDPNEMNNRYFKNRTDGFCVSNNGRRLITASKIPMEYGTT